MSFGDPSRGGHAWALDETASRPILHRALDAGINFFDTANIYSNGSSEEIVGRVLLGAVPRDDLVIATKVGLTRQGPDSWIPVGRPAYLRQQVELNLRNLGVDRLDLLRAEDVGAALAKLGSEKLGSEHSL